MIQNYHIVIPTEPEKYRYIDIVRAAGAAVTGVSGYGTGYYIQIDATPEQVAQIDREWLEV